MIKSLLVFMLTIPLLAMAQVHENNLESKVQLGIEQDILPYALSGYFLSGWIGKRDIRIRFAYAKAQQPNFILDDYVTANTVYAFGMSTEFFLKQNFEGWWLGPGIGFWKEEISTLMRGNGIHNSTIFTLGGGYNKSIWKGLYISPWLACHLRVQGMENYNLNIMEFTPNLITPEVSIKVGYKFQL